MLTCLFLVVAVPSLVLSAPHEEYLSCLFEREGTLFDHVFHDAIRSNQCTDKKYCQKIEANYISLMDQRTSIRMRGCDGMRVDGLYGGYSCQKEGCVQIMDRDEQYTVCCCSTRDCNSSNSFSYSSSLILVLVSLFILRP